MFWVGFLYGLGLGLILSLISGLLFFAKRSLNLEKSSSIIGTGFIRPKASSKRRPKALTDLMAYNRELQEEGENRG